MKRIKVGDNVKIIQGRNKGETGKVISLLQTKNKLVVSGINKKIKHVKSSQKDKVGKIITFEAPLDISNVMLCNEEGIKSKVAFIFKDDKKIRILKKTNQIIQK